MSKHLEQLPSSHWECQVLRERVLTPEITCTGHSKTHTTQLVHLRVKVTPHLENQVEFCFFGRRTSPKSYICREWSCCWVKICHRWNNLISLIYWLLSMTKMNAKSYRISNSYLLLIWFSSHRHQEAWGACSTTDS